MASAPAFAQTVSGRVTSSADGQPLPGVSILVKGTNTGTTTNAEGNFTVNANADQMLVLSFIGYATKEVVVGNATTLTISLDEDISQLNEVVVTALGIERDKKELGYSVQSVSGDQLTEARDVNVANALAGKVAGVQIKQNATGVGGSTRITIRGNNTISGSNQPLIVVDGIPMSNFESSPDDYWGNSAIDKGSGLGDISPDAIASISVLKGPAAAALYGSRAANGVILVTTKTGKNSPGSLSFSSNFTFERPMMTPKFQNKYGQGMGGTFNNNVKSSWGPEMDGSTQTMALGELPYSARDNDLYNDFLRTGTTWTNNVQFSKSVEDLTFLAGITRLDNKAVVPNSGLDRTSVNIRTTAKITSWLSFDGKMNYINQNSDNRISIALDPNNIFYDNLYRPRSVAFSDYRPFKNNNWKRDDGKPASYVIDHGNSPNNVFWSAYRNGNADERDRYIGFAALDFTITDWLSLKLRTGMDNYSLKYETIRATGNPYWEQGGSYRMQTERFKEINSDFLLSAKKDFNKIGIVATLGGNRMKQTISSTNTFSGDLEIPEQYNIRAGKQHWGVTELKEKQINSVYGAVSLSYAGQLFLDVTGRNDWASTLPVDNNSYFYPSVGASWVFTETMKNLGPLSFGKLRASWAQVGNDADFYKLEDYYTPEYNILGESMTVRRSDTRANPNLKHESVQSVEAGLELLFGDRIGLDVAWYKTNTYDQVLKLDIPPGTGFLFDVINAGNVQNTGVELMLNTTPVLAGDFRWESSINWSMNRNKVVELHETSKTQILSLGATPVRIIAKEGGSYGDIFGSAYLRDENGKKVIDANGIPVSDGVDRVLGNALPKGILGWSNTISYKNLSLGFLIDMTYGGDIYMGSINIGTSAGTLAMTADHREGGLIVDGVTQVEGEPNSTAITAEQYWRGISTIDEEFIYDATNVRFREFTLNYSLPQSLLSKTPFKTVKAGIVARNLFMIYSTTEGFDPEAGYSSSSSALGMEFASMPTMRSIGFNVKLGF
ncbi:MAG TPA: SusC/RagA family TonB-linked outer membrane protein [Ohtaekwangia sp.]|nr:SusC/RagA family TonB-linked outer membrane protein [Ohtaekwangia sp.]